MWQRVSLAELSVDVYNKHNLSYGYSGKLYDTSDITNDNVLGVFGLYIERGRFMRKISIGKQDYESLITSGCFYVDKTYFIKEWWESQDDVTLITRPRRFGKTLNMSIW